MNEILEGIETVNELAEGVVENLQPAAESVVTVVSDLGNTEVEDIVDNVTNVSIILKQVVPGWVAPVAITAVVGVGTAGYFLGNFINKKVNKLKENRVKTNELNEDLQFEYEEEGA